MTTLEMADKVLGQTEHKDIINEWKALEELVGFARNEEAARMFKRLEAFFFKLVMESWHADIAADDLFGFSEGIYEAIRGDERCDSLSTQSV